MDAVIYAGSHRKGGNSDRAAELLQEGIRQAGGEATIHFVRDAHIIPCIACGFCDKTKSVTHKKRCAIAHKDQAWELFAPLFEARVALFASPIYFYHLPSRLKTWIDRGQQFWQAHNDNEPWIAELPRRKAHAFMIAGQPSGEKLFEGARLTLKYFVQNFNMTLEEPLGFRGIDRINDLKQRQDFESRIIQYAEQVWIEAR